MFKPCNNNNNNNNNNLCFNTFPCEVYGKSWLFSVSRGHAAVMHWLHCALMITNSSVLDLTISNPNWIRIWGEPVFRSQNNTPDETNGVNNAVSCYKEAVLFSAFFVTSMFASF